MKSSRMGEPLTAGELSSAADTASHPTQHPNKEGAVSALLVPAHWSRKPGCMSDRLTDMQPRTNTSISEGPPSRWPPKWQQERLRVIPSSGLLPTVCLRAGRSWMGVKHSFSRFLVDLLTTSFFFTRITESGSREIICHFLSRSYCFICYRYPASHIPRKSYAIRSCWATFSAPPTAYCPAPQIEEDFVRLRPDTCG